MIEERHLQIVNKMGLHVRPATSFSETASKFKSTITITKDGRTINAKSSIELLTLAAIEGTHLILRAEGEDAVEAVMTLEKLIQSRFGEE